MKRNFWVWSVCCFVVPSILSVVMLVEQIKIQMDTRAYQLTLPKAHKTLYVENTKVLGACKGGITYGKTEFAFVSMLSNIEGVAMRDLGNYISSASKLGESIKKWTNLDTVMMIVGSEPLASEHIQSLESVGWIMCYVDEVENPYSHISNRFLSAKMYSKLNVWYLVEYSAVLMMDSDTLVIRDPVPVFTSVYVKMRENHMLIAADIHERIVEDNILRMCAPDPSAFNAGVFLLLPNMTTFQHLKTAMHNIPHIYEWAEQSLLNVYFKNSVYEMSFIYNANVASIVCEPQMWRQMFDKLVIIHYTVVKPWGGFFFQFVWRTGVLNALWVSAR